jgi:hypothetical protein
LHARFLTQRRQEAKAQRNLFNHEKHELHEMKTMPPRRAGLRGVRAIRGSIGMKMISSSVLLG